jgi:threonine aldolase
VVATGTSARQFAATFDSAWIDLSKGLGAPVGAVLAGSGAFIEEAWRYKQRFGGAMRQAGIIAAAGVYALRHHVDRLAEDHERARQLARGLAELRGVAIDPERVETNIVIFDVGETGLSGDDFAARTLASHGVRFSVLGPTIVRAVTHLDIPADGVSRALEAARVALRM